ncbi:DUF2231 domain-containing protein [Nocardioides litoris]|uniref:DUF2231 domain-containing protein n=1 Tax=Nocardioides litoris TaxID=1926648 RepID=UPI0011218865|nr:DUF2231 domain-containing protein [Nocardioides litoris]
MSINGLPLHALVVHAAVVFGPLAGLAAVLYAAVPRWRDWLRWPLVGVAAIALVSIWVAYFSGESVEEANPTFYTDPARAALLETHEERAGVLRISVTVLALVSFGAAWLHTRTGATRIALGVGVAALGVLTLVYTVLTGDAGAELKWAGYQS